MGALPVAPPLQTTNIDFLRKSYLLPSNYWAGMATPSCRLPFITPNSQLK